MLFCLQLPFLTLFYQMQENVCIYVCISMKISCHPRGCKKGIPYAEEFRLRNNCSSVQLFDRRAGNLVARGFDEGLVRQQMKRVRRVTRDEALTPFPDRKTNSRVPFIPVHHRSLPDLSPWLAKYRRDIAGTLPPLDVGQ